MKTSTGRRTMSALLAALFCLLGVTALDASAGSKVVDWDKKLVKARQLRQENNLDAALKILSEFARKYPESAAVHTEYGLTLKAKNNKSDAKSEFRRATEVEPNYAAPWYELGCLQQADSEYSEAVTSFEHYLQLDPSSDKKNSVKDRLTFCKQKI